MPYKNQEAVSIQDRVRIDKYRAAFNAVWLPHMQNGGQTETNHRRKIERRKVHESLAQDFPLETKCLNAYRKAMQYGFIHGKLENQLTEEAIVGRAILNALNAKEDKKPTVSRNGKKIGRPKKDDIELAKKKYESCLANRNWIPADGTAAVLMGCSLKTVEEIRKGASERYDLYGNVIQGGIVFGWFAKPKPQPEPEPPSLVERIKAKLGALRQDELQAIDELLEEAVAPDRK